jgi:hypothetical protein
MYKPKRILELAMWGVANIYGELCYNENGLITFDTELDAQEFCVKINVCNDSGICTNFI